MTNPFPAQNPDDIEYPSSDGEPVGETDIHIEELITLRTMLRIRYRNRDDVYVAGNLFVYYEEGNPHAVVCPDSFVVFGVSSANRRVFKVWQERAVPSFVMEFTSRKTWLEDVGNKKALYARLGVEEYFLFDPEEDYLHPSLQGHRLVDGEYQPIEIAGDGSIESRSLGLIFQRDGVKLRCLDAGSGKVLLRPLELHAALTETERRRIEADRARTEADRARTEAEQRTRALEAEIERLRAELERQKR